MAKAESLVGMTPPALKETILEAKVGTWIKVHWIDAEPMYVLVAEKPRKQVEDIKVYRPISGRYNWVGFNQVSKVGEVVSIPS